MKKHDIEAYLAGELNPAERRALEAEMAGNPAFAQEVARQRQLVESIEDAVLWERVSAARAQRKQRWHWRWLAILALALGGGLWWYMLNFPSEKGRNPVPPAEQTVPAPDAPQAQAEETAPPTNRPIADAQPGRALPPPLHPAPQLRGQSTADTSRKALLDAIWHTEYPPAGLQLAGPYRQVDELLVRRDFSKSYARLQLLERKMPANDTLFFLKGYCLLERGEGGEALRYFDKIENRTPFGNDLLEWYRGLALLLSGENEKAKKTFMDISAKPSHPFHKQAQQATKMME